MFKKYKEKSPESTINLIRKILEDCEVFLKETSTKKDNLHSCRLTIENNELDGLDIGTNGKGRSYLYSLASGYAEFMERIQNDMLINENSLRYIIESIRHSVEFQNSLLYSSLEAQDLIPDFVYDPDEKYLKIDELTQLYGEELMKMFSFNDLDELVLFLQSLRRPHGFLCTKFYSVELEKEVYFPIDLAFLSDGSNGMCAGNTSEEAILQGFCEVFERYAVANIYFNHITPPSIPMETFKGSYVYDKLRYLNNEYGYEFIVKDCSMGYDLPVIGLIIIDRKNNLYNFKVGADFVPHIALERCVTELFQSRSGAIKISFLKTQNNLDYGSDYTNEQYMKTIKNGTGQWPITIFSSEVSYQFNGFNPSYGNTNYSDLRNSLDLIKKMGANVYIRNCSYLGFPSFNIVVPGMSNLFHKGSAQYLQNNFMLSLDQSRLLRVSTPYSLDEFIDITVKWLEENLDKHNEFTFNDLFPYYTSKELADLDPQLFLAMSYYYKMDYEKSYNHMCMFLEGKGVDYEYYYACCDYIKAKNNSNENKILSILSNKYSRIICEEVIEDMSVEKDIFQYYSFDQHLNIEFKLRNCTSKLLRILSLKKQLTKKRLSWHPTDKYDFLLK